MRRIPKSIPGFAPSYALLSESEHVDTAVIFVHGFGGSATGTWRNFQGLVEEYSSEYPWWNAWDLFFYSYESLKTPIGVNAHRLRSFLKDVLSSSNLREIKPIDGAQPTFTWGSSDYQILFCVGHSEGAVVIRRMILDRLNEAREGVEGIHDGPITNLGSGRAGDLLMNASMRFFAPACLGTNFSSWFGFGMSFSTLISALAASSLVRNELLPESPILKQIQSETETAHKGFPSMRALTAKVLFGDRDQVVYTGAYNCDGVFYERGQDHFSICKPKYIYRRPLEFVSP